MNSKKKLVNLSFARKDHSGSESDSDYYDPEFNLKKKKLLRKVFKISQIDQLYLKILVLLKLIVLHIYKNTKT